MARLDSDPASAGARPSAGAPSKTAAPPRSVYDPSVPTPFDAFFALPAVQDALQQQGPEQAPGQPRPEQAPGAPARSAARGSGGGRRASLTNPYSDQLNVGELLRRQRSGQEASSAGPEAAARSDAAPPVPAAPDAQTAAEAPGREDDSGVEGGTGVMQPEVLLLSLPTPGMDVALDASGPADAAAARTASASTAPEQAPAHDRAARPPDEPELAAPTATDKHNLDADRLRAIPEEAPLVQSAPEQLVSAGQGAADAEDAWERDSHGASSQGAAAGSHEGVLSRAAAGVPAHLEGVSLADMDAAVWAGLPQDVQAYLLRTLQPGGVVSAAAAAAPAQGAGAQVHHVSCQLGACRMIWMVSCYGIGLRTIA